MTIITRNLPNFSYIKDLLGSLIYSAYFSISVVNLGPLLTKIASFMHEDKIMKLLEKKNNFRLFLH